MSRCWVFSLGSNRRNPEVGLGVVGRKTLTTSLSMWLRTGPSVLPVMKPIAHTSLRGYSINTTSRKALDFCARTVSKICLRAL